MNTGATGSAVDWSKVNRFNFTYAIPGGAWLEWGPFVTSEGPKLHVEWYSFKEIERHLGWEWIDRQLKKQGWMTGCWVNVG